MDRPLHELHEDEVADLVKDILEPTRTMVGDENATKEAERLLEERGFDLTDAYIRIDTMGRQIRARIPRGPHGEIDIACLKKES